MFPPVGTTPLQPHCPIITLDTYTYVMFLFADSPLHLPI